MTVTKNNGYNRDKEMYPYQVESGVRGQVNYQVSYIDAEYGQCSCGRIDCEHLQAWINHMAEEAVQ